jgi:hypothetical protein
MIELDTDKSVLYEGKSYCVQKDGKIITIVTEELDVRDCPPCVVEAIFRKLLEGRR